MECAAARHARNARRQFRRGLLGARGCVTAKDAANRIYTVTVAWQGLKATTAPADTCARNLYGDEALRRVVSADVQVASLTAP